MKPRLRDEGHVDQQVDYWSGTSSLVAGVVNLPTPLTYTRSPPPENSRPDNQGL